jgi:Holliday junction resolvase RusA-like endonuclease
MDATGFDTSWFTALVLGEPASKSNSRKLVTIGGRPRFIKSKKALEYEKGFYIQTVVRDLLFQEDVVLAVRVWYKSRRPDLDITHIKDCLQGVAYENDRSVKIEHAVWDYDTSSPRSYIVVAPVSDFERVLHHLHHEREQYASRFLANR